MSSSKINNTDTKILVCFNKPAILTHQTHDKQAIVDFFNNNLRIFYEMSEIS